MMKFINTHVNYVSSESDFIQCVLMMFLGTKFYLTLHLIPRLFSMYIV